MTTKKKATKKATPGSKLPDSGDGLGATPMSGAFAGDPAEVDLQKEVRSLRVRVSELEATVKRIVNHIRC